MPTIDEKFIKRLDDFTHSLEGLVALLKEDLKKGNTDNVNEMLASMNDNIGKVSKEIETIVKSTKKIETTTDKILAEVRAAKKSKETPDGFQTVSETENKKKIIDAVKVIVLIAAGILAMGLALKLISPVNFLSVIAIGLSMVFIAGAFVMVAALTEGMGWKEAAGVSSIMVIMAAGIAVSSWALAAAATISAGKMASIIFTATAMGIALVLMTTAVKKADLKPTDYLKIWPLPFILPLIAVGITVSSIILSGVKAMTFGQVLTTIFVAAAIGTSLYLITQAISKSKFDPKDIGKFFALALIIPALAMGLVVASWILSAVKTLSFMQMISAVFVAVTIGILVYLMKPLIEKMKDLSLGQILNTTLLVAALAAGLVVASVILTKMHFFTFKESLQLIMTSLAIGLAVLFITPAVYILKSIKTDDMIQAGGNIVIAAAAIFASSWLLSLGNYDNYPDWQWSLGSGLAILAFAGTMWLIKKMDLNKTSLMNGAFAVIGISAVIMLTSWILSVGNYEEYPSLGWALGVGLSLIAFGSSMMIIGFIISASGGAVAGLMALGALATLGVALVIVAVSYILGIGNYNKYPSIEWATGVGLSLIAFGGAMVALGFFLPLLALGALSMGVIAFTILGVSKIISMGDYSNGPPVEWAESVSLLMNRFAWAMIKTAFIPNILLERCAAGLMIIAQNIVDVSNKLTEGNYEGGPSVGWATGTGLLITAFAMTSIMMGLALPFLLLGSLGMNYIAQSIVDVSNKLAEGNYNGGPDEKWAKGVGQSILAFAQGIAALQETDSFLSFGIDQGQKIIDIAEAMKIANITLASVKWSDNYPSEGWAKGVGGAIMAFAKALALLDDAGIKGSDFLYNVIWLSLGIIAAAKTLDLYDWSTAKNYPSAEWSTGVGNAIKAFADPLAKLGEVDITGGDIRRSIRKLAQGMVDAAEILGEYKNWGDATTYPSAEWSTGVGKAIGTFVKYLVEIEKNDIGRGDIRNLNRTIDSMVSAALTFSFYNAIFGDIWAAYPSSEWSIAVGSAIGTFVKYLVDIEKNDIGRGEIRNLNRTIDSMISTALKFSLFGDIWTSYPKEEWSTGVGSAIGTFVKYLVEIEKSDIGGGDFKNLNKIVDGMIDMGIKFKNNEGIWANYPPAEWSDGILKSIEAFTQSINLLSNADQNFGLLVEAGYSMIMFAEIVKKMDDYKNLFKENGPLDNFSTSIKKLVENLPTKDSIEGLKTLAEVLNSISSMGISSSMSIYMLSQAVSDLGESLSSLDTDAFTNLSKFSNGMLVLSLIDEKKLEDTLKVLDQKKNEIKSILSESSNAASKVRETPDINRVMTFKEEVAGGTVNKNEEFYTQMLSYVKTLNDNVSIMAKREPAEKDNDEGVVGKPGNVKDKAKG